MAEQEEQEDNKPPPFKPSHSLLDPVSKDLALFKLKETWGDLGFTAVYERGVKKVSTMQDLNVHFNADHPPKNAKHWPFSAAIREIISNAIDASLGSMEELTSIPKIEVIPSKSIPFSGIITINKFLAVSFRVAIDVVESSTEHRDKHNDNGGRYPLKYIETKRRYEIEYPHLRKGKTNRKKPNKRK